MYTIKALPRKNSRRYTKIIATFTDDYSILEYLKTNNIKAIGTPYFFAHIDLDNGQIITQDFNGIICSPTRLAELLKIK